MRDQRDTPSPMQLEFEFMTAASAVKAEMQTADNVVRLQFGSKKTIRAREVDEDALLIERVLQNAQKLKW